MENCDARRATARRHRSRLVVIADDVDLHAAARWLTGLDIGLVVVCDGDGGAAVTGQVIAVDGGLGLT